MCTDQILSALVQLGKCWQLLLFISVINCSILFAQPPDSADRPMYFLTAGTFFSPSMNDTYFSPALDLETGFWKTNHKNFFSWGASAEVWNFTSIKYGLGDPIISNNTDGFINLNTMFFYHNKIIIPYVAPSVSVVSDFNKIGFSGGLALGLNHQTTDKLQIFVQSKYVKFSNRLTYLDTYFFMIGLSLKLSD